MARTPSSVSVRLVEVTGFNYQILTAGPGQWPSGQWREVRVRAQGGRVCVRQWDPAVPEPTTWGIDTTVARVAAGYAGFAVGPSAAPANYRCDIDNFQLWPL